MVLMAQRSIAVFATRAGDDKEQGRKQNRHREREGYQSNRCFHHGPIAIGIVNDANRKAADYPANGVAIETLIDSTVSVTTRHSENAPIASVAAMALVNREEATGAGRLTKPTMPGDRIMVQFLQDAGESPANIRQLCLSRLARLRQRPREKPETAASVNVHAPVVNL
jgi:hypothetical protein